MTTIAKGVQIEKNIPMPEGRGHGDSLTAKVRVMEVGDSLIWPTTYSRSSVSAIARQVGVKLTSRTQPDGTVRVWRMG